MRRSERNGAVERADGSAAFEHATAQVDAALAALRDAEASLERQLADLRAYRGASGASDAPDACAR